MKKLISLGILSLVLLLSTSAFALDAVQQRYINMLTNGGPISIREAAQSIYRTGDTNQTVLDTLAEVVLENQKTDDGTNIDAMSWGCKALGRSHVGRYHDVLKEVAENGGSSKLRKYASKSLDELGEAKGEQYKKGMVSLAKMKKSSASQMASKPAASNGKKQPLSVVKKGMSMQEVYALVGTPTATTSYQTGKAWIPFNFKGSDNRRTAALYKGQGRVIFSNDSNYSSGMHVLEIKLDKNESGYP